jgi:hypothetical protein
MSHTFVPAFVLSLLASVAGVAACAAQQDLGNSPTDPANTENGDPQNGDADGGDATASGNKLRVFVTSATFTGDLATAGEGGSGIASGDAICQTAADGAHLGGRFVAFLSGGKTHAVDHVVDDGPFYKLDGRALVYDSKAAIAGGTKVDPSSGSYGSHFTLSTESGSPVAATDDFWTGSLDNGHASGNDCNQWTSTDGSFHGVSADVTGTRSSANPCVSKRPLLCVEQRSPAPKIAKKRIFVSSKVVKGDLMASGKTGFQSADAFCTSSAKAAGLTGTWVAWLSGKDGGKVVRAHDRISENIYTQMDGRSAFASKAELDGVPINTIDMTEFGAKIEQRLVWTGTLKGGAPSSFRCNEWTSSSYNDNGTYGVAGNKPDAWTGPEVESGSYTSCDDTASLYCFEQ